MISHPTLTNTTKKTKAVCELVEADLNKFTRKNKTYISLWPLERVLLNSNHQYTDRRMPGCVRKLQQRWESRINDSDVWSLISEFWSIHETASRIGLGNGDWTPSRYPDILSIDPPNFEGNSQLESATHVMVFEMQLLCVYSILSSLNGQHALQWQLTGALLAAQQYSKLDLIRTWMGQVSCITIQVNLTCNLFFFDRET